MRRRFTTALVITLLLASGGTARAERTLEGEVGLALAEATTIENTIGAATLRGTPQAKFLRRGKKSLQKALEQHAAGETKAAAKFFGNGIGKLRKAFRNEDPAGQSALDGILDELVEWAAAREPEVRSELEGLPDSEPKNKGLQSLNVAASMVDKYQRSSEFYYQARFALVAYGFIGKAEKKVLRARDLQLSGPCVLTDPDIQSIGGGWWEVSVDGAPPVRLQGETFVDAFSATERSFAMGSDQHAAPYIYFYVAGPITTHPGTYPVRRATAADDDEFSRDFAEGFWQDSDWVIGGRAWRFRSGTITISKVRLGDPKKKRRIDGTFNVVGEDRGGDERTITGRFHLCHFGVAGGGNDDGN